MIDLFISFVNVVAGIVTTGFGVTVLLAGIKIIITGLGWVF